MELNVSLVSGSGQRARHPSPLFHIRVGGGEQMAEGVPELVHWTHTAHFEREGRASRSERSGRTRPARPTSHRDRLAVLHALLRQFHCLHVDM